MLFRSKPIKRPFFKNLKSILRNALGRKAIKRRVAIENLHERNEYTSNLWSVVFMEINPMPQIAAIRVNKVAGNNLFFGNTFISNLS